MKSTLFSTAVVLGSAALAVAAPHAHAEVQHGHHAHKRAVAYEYVYLTVTVDSEGNPIEVQTTEGVDVAADIATDSPVAATTTSAAAATTSAAAAAASSSAVVVVGDDSTSSAAEATSVVVATSSSSEVAPVSSSDLQVTSTQAVASSSSAAEEVSSAAPSTSSSAVAQSSSSAYVVPSSTSLAVVASSSSSAEESSSSASGSSSPSSSTSSSASSSSSSSSSDDDDDSSSSSSSDISISAAGSEASCLKPVSAYSTISDSFEDGYYDCDTFPADEPGVISLDYLGYGGWSGIYNSDTSTGGSCSEGSYCSYSCQPGMSKTQWPSDQPSSGVSVGGLYCKGGKLYRSNSDASNLCVWGVDSSVVVSKLSEDVAICRTDYPGTENMVIPTIVGAGSTAALTCVDQSSYYVWNGKKTSAQYYVNNAGVSQADGCVWGESGSGVGNWAPLNFGAGYVDGVAYLSIIPNPNNKSAANFNVKIVADGDDSVVNGECVYENGSYNGSGSDGCTVAVTKGRAKFVLYN